MLISCVNLNSILSMHLQFISEEVIITTMSCVECFTANSYRMQFCFKGTLNVCILDDCLILSL